MKILLHDDRLEFDGIDVIKLVERALDHISIHENDELIVLHVTKVGFDSFWVKF
ncbi:hypothetical protein Fmac_029790 [Flemingia macrophylla]|uniref:Uncharacterized protein n=1 Tax=Flemingia macrophylla TaxID=520843 RepID=A0ABD1LBH8_9FABA